MPNKPEVTFLDKNGNVFSLVAVANKALKKVGQNEQAKEMQTAVFASGSYDEAIQIMMKYVEVVG